MHCLETQRTREPCCNGQPVFQFEQFPRPPISTFPAQVRDLLGSALTTSNAVTCRTFLQSNMYKPLRAVHCVRLIISCLGDPPNHMRTDACDRNVGGVEQ